MYPYYQDSNSGQRATSTKRILTCPTLLTFLSLSVRPSQGSICSKFVSPAPFNWMTLALTRSWLNSITALLKAEMLEQRATLLPPPLNIHFLLDYIHLRGIWRQCFKQEMDLVFGHIMHNKSEWNVKLINLPVDVILNWRSFAPRAYQLLSVYTFLSHRGFNHHFQMKHFPATRHRFLDLAADKLTVANFISANITCSLMERWDNRVKVCREKSPRGEAEIGAIILS